MAQKVAFDVINKLMTVTVPPDGEGKIDLDVKVDLYSDGKEDWLISGSLNKLKFPIRVVGGDPVSPEKDLGATFFLLHGWRIRPYEIDHRFIITGNLYTDPYGYSPIVATSGSYNVVVEYSVSNLIDATINRLDIENIQRLIETQRPHHTGTGDMWYWDPYGGNDNNDGKLPESAFKTFAKAQEEATDSNHDVIICYPGNPSGVTVTSETLNISKRYLFIRGPGRDFQIIPTDTSQDTITIDADGVEVSSLVVKTASSGDKNVISIGKDFAWLANLWIEPPVMGSGISISNSEFSAFESVFVSGSVGDGINIGSGVNGLTIDSGVKVQDCSGYGINIGSGASKVCISTNVVLDGNTLGNVNDQGSNTYYSDKVDRVMTTDAIWDEQLSQHQVSGSAGKVLSDAGAGGDPAAIVAAIWNASLSNYSGSATAGYALDLVRKVESGRWKAVGTQMIFYDDDGVTPLLTFDLKDKDGQPIGASEDVMERDLA